MDVKKIKYYDKIVPIFTTGKLRSSLDHRDTRAEPPHGLRQFKAGVPAAQDNEMPRQAI